VAEMFQDFSVKFGKKLDDMQVFENVLKDEEDRLEERLKQNANEQYSFQAMIVASFKKLQGDIFICGDDIGALAQIVRSLIDNAHYMLTSAET